MTGTAKDPRIPIFGMRSDWALQSLKIRDSLEAFPCHKSTPGHALPVGRRRSDILWPEYSSKSNWRIESILSGHGTKKNPVVIFTRTSTLLAFPERGNRSGLILFIAEGLEDSVEKVWKLEPAMLLIPRQVQRGELCAHDLQEETPRAP
jgi:hypothetical protein